MDIQGPEEEQQSEHHYPRDLKQSQKQQQSRFFATRSGVHSDNQAGRSSRLIWRLMHRPSLKTSNNCNRAHNPKGFDSATPPTRACMMGSRLIEGTVEGSQLLQGWCRQQHRTHVPRAKGKHDGFVMRRRILLLGPLLLPWETSLLVPRVSHGNICM